MLYHRLVIRDPRRVLYHRLVIHVRFHESATVWALTVLVVLAILAVRVVLAVLAVLVVLAVLAVQVVLVVLGSAAVLLMHVRQAGRVRLQVRPRVLEYR